MRKILLTLLLIVLVGCSNGSGEPETATYEPYVALTEEAVVYEPEEVTVQEIVTELEEETHETVNESSFNFSMEDFTTSFNAAFGALYETSTGLPVDPLLLATNRGSGYIDGRPIFEFRISDTTFLRIMHSPFTQASYHMNTGRFDLSIEANDEFAMAAIVRATGSSFEEAINLVLELIDETDDASVRGEAYRVVGDIRFTLARSVMGIHSFTAELAE